MLLINFIFTSLIAQIFAENYFCHFSCGKDHTVCARPNCERGTTCGSNLKILPFSDDERSLILALHNERRNYVASGNETRFGNGQASNMNALSYSKELEFVAQCWTNNCETRGDTCRSTKKFPGAVGQNRKWFYVNPDGNLTATSYLEDTISAWYGYIDSSNASIIDYLEPWASSLYTQLIFAKTTQIGCGRVAFGFDTWMLLIVCNYGKAHTRRQPVYLRGEPCSECSKCNKNYTSLCGDIEDFTKDTWTPPNNNVLSSAEDKDNTNNETKLFKNWNENDRSIIMKLLEDIVGNSRLNDSITQTTENYLASNISEINKKLINLENSVADNLKEFKDQQEKQLVQISHQIEHNRKLNDLKIDVDNLRENNEKNFQTLLKQQKQIFETVSNNGSFNN